MGRVVSVRGIAAAAAVAKDKQDTKELQAAGKRQYVTRTLGELGEVKAQALEEGEAARGVVRGVLHTVLEEAHEGVQELLVRGRGVRQLAHAQRLRHAVGQLDEAVHARVRGARAPLGEAGAECGHVHLQVAAHVQLLKSLQEVLDRLGGARARVHEVRCDGRRLPPVQGLGRVQHRADDRVQQLPH